MVLGKHQKGDSPLTVWHRRLLAAAVALVSFVVVIYGCSIVASNVFGFQVMYVTSESMEPTFKRGDMIIGTRNPQSISPGDIITFRAKWFDGEIVTHRVSRVLNDVEGGAHGESSVRPVSRNAQIYTYGDNNSVEDPEPITISDVDTEIVSIVPNFGYVIFRETLISILSLAFLLWLASLVAELKDEKKERAKKRAPLAPAVDTRVSQQVCQDPRIPDRLKQFMR